MKKAHSIDKQCVRASYLLGRIAMQKGDFSVAIRYFNQIRDHDCDFIIEALSCLHQCFLQLGSEKACIEWLRQCLARCPHVSVLCLLSELLTQYHGVSAAIEEVSAHLQKFSSWSGLALLVKLYLLVDGSNDQRLQFLSVQLSNLSQQHPAYRCERCGVTTQTLYWLCPGCHGWSTIRSIQDERMVS